MRTQLDDASEVPETSSDSLDLGDGNMGDMDVKHIYMALQKNSLYKKLHLQNNKIGFLGASSLRQVLIHNHVWTSINLENNDIGDLGAAVLSDGLMQNNSVRSINLRNNKIGLPGIMALIDAMRKNYTLCFLPYENINADESNRLPESILATLAFYLKRNVIIAASHNYLNQLVEYKEANASFCVKINELRNELKSHLPSLDLFDPAVPMETYRLLKIASHFHEGNHAKMELDLNRPFANPLSKALAEEFKRFPKQPVVPQEPVRRLSKPMRLEPISEVTHEQTRTSVPSRQEGFWGKENCKITAAANKKQLEPISVAHESKKTSASVKFWEQVPPKPRLEKLKKLPSLVPWY